MKELTVKEFTKLYNQWRSEVSAIGKYAKQHTFNDTTSGGLETLVKAYFKMFNIACWKIDVSGTLRQTKNGYRMTTTKADKGISDLFVLINGSFLALEVKIGKDFQSSQQIRFETNVIKQGGHYRIITSFSDFQRKLFKMIENGTIHLKIDFG